MKVSLIEPLGVSEAIILEYGQKISDLGHEFEYYDSKTQVVDELVTRADDADILMIANNPLPAEVIVKLKNLKLLNVAFTGIDHVDTDALSTIGASICNASGYSDPAVAELVIGLVLDLYRSISRGDKLTRVSGVGTAGKEIKGKTVGIIGTGNIGLETSKLFHAFGAKLIGYSRTEKNEFIELGGVYKTLDEVLSESDIVSIHVPSNDQTENMIGHEELSKMKKSAIFINCARGRVVDNDALAKVLNDQLIAGAGIDVFDMEPPVPSDYPLLSAKNAILTPHVAYLTEEAMIRRAEIAFDNTISFLQGNPKNIIDIKK